ncbi:hypothetical protein [Paucisalibacillus sp. EB02]|uniref:hypothetical protein n=1 Tax=Paucisalibacillus sp. EB02 TaxID=1347087 RepID=UPI0005A76102|nr:hypothetical protein [Paucisalibacillus sp. EB02]
MRKLLSILVVAAVVFSSGCSSQTLQDAISSEYGKYDKPEILYHNDEVGVVILLTKDDKNNFIICRSSYEKNGFNRYVLDTTNDYSMIVDIGKKSEFIQLDTIGNSTDTPLNIVWGGVFHYPRAKQIAYKVHDGQEMIVENLVNINKKHVFVDVLSNEVTDSYKLTFDVIDNEGNVLFSYN